MFAMGDKNRPVDIAKAALVHAKTNGFNVLILDTAGRLHIDEEMMQELQDIKAAVPVDQTLLVVDAMTGQDAVNVAEMFSNKVGIDGVVLTKLDGDTRGGAALSVKKVTGKPIKFAATGEKLSDIEVFHPERMASRILGMGDVLCIFLLGAGCGVEIGLEILFVGSILCLCAQLMQRVFITHVYQKEIPFVPWLLVSICINCLIYTAFISK